MCWGRLASLSQRHKMNAFFLPLTIIVETRNFTQIESNMITIYTRKINKIKRFFLFLIVGYIFQNMFGVVFNVIVPTTYYPLF